jgi:hypothetical protein
MKVGSLASKKIGSLAERRGINKKIYEFVICSDLESQNTIVIL